MFMAVVAKENYQQALAEQDLLVDSKAWLYQNLGL